MAWFVGVDVGGTFTDFFAYDRANGRFMVHKIPSTPANPAEAIASGLHALAQSCGIELREVSRFSHGTTVATNALLQRRGGDVVLVTTGGFKDLIEIGRQVRPKMYDLQEDQPEPVVVPKNRLELGERISATGEVLRPIDEGELELLVESIQEIAPDSVAVCFLFSFRNSAHEERVANRIRSRCPDIYITTSSEVQPEFREYERLSTTVINAYLRPVMDRYLGNLAADLRNLTPIAHIGINQSSGGLMSIERARRFPIRTALSGPAAGAIGAIHVARSAGEPDVVTLDMGGTSADVALIRGYSVENTFDREIGGFPVRLPVMDINTVGAGGGSMAWFDADGLLKVGPRSAGADPGPACYGKGGPATVSDANLLLGRIGGRGLLGGKFELDLDAATQAVTPIAEQLNCTVESAAHGIIAIVNSNMVRAIRAVSVERGFDPRDLVLMPFGGAGAVHAGEIARELGMRRILVPLLPGILCAQGLIVSDLKEDFVQTVQLLIDGSDPSKLNCALDDLLVRAASWYDEEDIPVDSRYFTVIADMRYVGQNYEIPIPIEYSGQDSIEVKRIVQDFNHTHERQYGYHSDDPVEMVNLRVTARGVLQKPSASYNSDRAEAPPVARATRRVWFNSAEVADAPVYERQYLMAGHRIEGPAIIEQMDSTIVMYPNDTALVDGALNIFVEVG